MKKGFTLIELLAVIVILAIIALIATPIVLNIINDTKESAILRSADFYIDALENEIMLENMKQGGNFNPNTCTITNKIITCDNQEINLKVDGEVPTSGSITFVEGKVTDVNLTYQNGTVTQNNKGELVFEKIDQESEVVLVPGLYDEKDDLIESWEELESFNIKEAIEQGTLLGMDFDGDGNIDGDLAMFIAQIYPKATKLVIDESVTEIGGHAFYGCSSLKEIIIPDSVTSIGDSAFSGCTSLTSITIPNSVTSIEEETFLGCTSLTNITIPESVTSIGYGAFSGCSSLTSITIPNSVTSIGTSVFEGCTSLTSATIGSGVTSIAGGTFYGCTSLTSVTIGSSVTSIESGAFYGCTSLKEITIPDNVTNIADDAFFDCTSLTTIYYKGTATGSPWGAPNAKIETNF